MVVSCYAINLQFYLDPNYNFVFKESHEGEGELVDSPCHTIPSGGRFISYKGRNDEKTSPNTRNEDGPKLVRSAKVYYETH